MMNDERDRAPASFIPGPRRVYAPRAAPGTRPLLRWAVTVGAGVAGALLAYAHLIEPRWLAVERWTARIPDLPPAWQGMRAVHLTDFQIGMWLQSRSLAPR